ncbi:MAG TPA: 3-isopropylmalate dehydrogenase [Anaerolineae bacterium]|nr:3-isopropylmalate dehydrogenase [Anaerolineae bacterium]HID84527.1 3-isopropylmalate dehydrogenase [Anaerolineales bacterium]HIQ09303.1 3-isopropylmalate dehydrogenase [Anaerolineaceae bacterium]
MHASLVLLPGDGIGPEVIAAARQVLEVVAQRFGHQWAIEEHPVGGAALESHGTPLPKTTLDACRKADAVLLGAVGGPRWDDLPPEQRPERGLLALRRGLETFANLRPVQVWPPLADRSPLKTARVQGVDFVVVRELTGGIYFGPRQEAEAQAPAWDTMRYTEPEIARIARLAARLAYQRRGLLVSVDKANVLASSRLWRQVVDRVVHEEFPGVCLEHRLVDAMAMDLLRHPEGLDVVVTANLFGDILTDEAAALTGSLGTLPSASLGAAQNRHGLPRGLYEPIHGSAPDIAGQGIANPSAAILSAALLLRHSLGLEREAQAVERAVQATWEAGYFTPDLSPIPEQACTTADFTAAVMQHLIEGTNGHG